MGRYLCLGYQGKFFWRDSFLIPASRFQNSQGCPGQVEDPGRRAVGILKWALVKCSLI
jgi:hypothetical protein